MNAPRKLLVKLSKEQELLTTTFINNCTTYNIITRKSSTPIIPLAPFQFSQAYNVYPTNLLLTTY